MIIATASEDGLTEKGFEILYRYIDNLATSHKKLLHKSNRLCCVGIKACDCYFFHDP